MTAHQDVVCSHTVVACQYDYLGCDIKVTYLHAVIAHSHDKRGVTSLISGQEIQLPVKCNFGSKTIIYMIDMGHGNAALYQLTFFSSSLIEYVFDHEE